MRNKSEVVRSNIYLSSHDNNYATYVNNARGRALFSVAISTLYVFDYSVEIRRFTIGKHRSHAVDNNYFTSNSSNSIQEW